MTSRSEGEAMERHAADVMVIGAGMAGATAAAHLAPTHRVALLEAEESAGYHATGRSAAIWIRNYGNRDVRILTAASRSFFLAPPAGFTEAPLSSPRPVLHLAPPEQVPLLEALVAGGQMIEPIGLDRARAMVPALRPDYAVAAAVETDCFDIDVAALHAGFLRALRQAGGVLALRRRASRIWRQGGLWHAETSGGDVFTAPFLVNAAGAWGDEVAEMAGEPRLGLAPKRRTACIIDPAPYAVRDWPLVGDAAHSWYARPEARSKLMLSPADETDSPPMDAWPEEIDVALAVERMQQALAIEVRRVEHAWAGLRTFTPDRSLAIGPGRSDGFFWMCGQGGYGIQTAPAAGALLAALLRGEAPPPGTEEAVALVDPRRFPLPAGGPRP
ncbi:MAG: FAD-dependent oxidoreductase [Rhodovarius sp.]|nr:FAD-binding oxidoreductase [Rhodovarius sp.]MDW8313346.1 FAD-dependent oxidoreductase [Rhodovarius sp.]